MIEKLPYEQIVDENFNVVATGTPHLIDVATKVDEIIEYLNNAAADTKENEPIKVPTLAQYRRAYEDWYLKSASEPVTYAQYLHIMERIPHEIFNILKLLDAQETHDEKTT